MTVAMILGMRLPRAQWEAPFRGARQFMARYVPQRDIGIMAHPTAPIAATQPDGPHLWDDITPGRQVRTLLDQTSIL